MTNLRNVESDSIAEAWLQIEAGTRRIRPEPAIVYDYPKPRKRPRKYYRETPVSRLDVTECAIVPARDAERWIAGAQVLRPGTQHRMHPKPNTKLIIVERVR